MEDWVEGFVFGGNFGKLSLARVCQHVKVKNESVKYLIMAFKDVRNLLLLSLDDGLIDDEHFLLLFDLYSSRQPDFPYDNYEPFDLDTFDV